MPGCCAEGIAACATAVLQGWMFILRYFAGFMVWATIAVVNAALVGCTLFAYNTAGMLTQAGQWGAAISAQLPPFADPTGASVTQLCQLAGLCRRNLCCLCAWQTSPYNLHDASLKWHCA
jgi:hypothetical protein